VALVGDFNGWDASASPLTLTPGAAGVWETSLLLPPGRHEYAFLVDGRVWTLDPRAPQAADDDFGRANSVTMVADR
jgi:1,4-alpha-glucan branching enzyme